MNRYVMGIGVTLGACRPAFNEDAALVATARVLAVKSEPAEAKPQTTVSFAALIAVPPSFTEVTSPSWSFCTAPKPPTEDNVVSSACLGAASLLPLGEGSTITALTPSDACTLFGPNAAASGLRPRDPDATGGYFQPLRVDLKGADPVFHLERVSCGLADASADIATEFGHEYVPNENPHLAPVSATSAGQSIEFDHISAGAQLELVARWSAADAQSYAYFDRTAQTVTTRRESMRVAWYVSAGKLDTESTGRAEDDPGLTSSNVWTAPDAPGSAKLWVVLRDSRGGVDFAAYDLTVLAR
jgi:hypothetical protein